MSEPRMERPASDLVGQNDPNCAPIRFNAEGAEVLNAEDAAQARGSPNNSVARESRESTPIKAAINALWNSRSLA